MLGDPVPGRGRLVHPPLAPGRRRGRHPPPCEGRCFVTTAMAGWAGRRTRLCWCPGWAPTAPTPHMAPVSPQPALSPQPRVAPALSPHGATHCGRGSAAILGRSRAKLSQARAPRHPPGTPHPHQHPNHSTPHLLLQGAAVGIPTPALGAPAPTTSTQPLAPLAAPGSCTTSLTPAPPAALPSPSPASPTAPVPHAPCLSRHSGSLSPSPGTAQPGPTDTHSTCRIPMATWDRGTCSSCPVPHADGFCPTTPPWVPAPAPDTATGGMEPPAAALGRKEGTGHGAESEARARQDCSGTAWSRTPARLLPGAAGRQSGTAAELPVAAPAPSCSRRAPTAAASSGGESPARRDPEERGGGGRGRGPALREPAERTVPGQPRPVPAGDAEPLRARRAAPTEPAEPPVTVGSRPAALT